MPGIAESTGQRRHGLAICEGDRIGIDKLRGGRTSVNPRGEPVGTEGDKQRLQIRPVVNNAGFPIHSNRRLDRTAAHVFNSVQTGASLRDGR